MSIQKLLLSILFILFILSDFILFTDSYAFSTSYNATSEPNSPHSLSWGGHFRAGASAGWPATGSLIDLSKNTPLIDWSSDLRLKMNLEYGKRFRLETHYEAVVTGGDTRKTHQVLLSRMFPGIGEIFKTDIPGDDRRFLSLTRNIQSKEDRIIYHRLDRLVLTWLPSWGAVRIGRQALTWGNGMLFQPMDLFNPFAPTDVVRDYKIGDDMAVVQFALDGNTDLELLYVPRRNPLNGKLEWNRSSAGGKLHLLSEGFELDLMAASHYQDTVMGIGGTGYFKDAAWRLDATWTFQKQGSPHPYFSLVANIDYSWVCLAKNMYGFIEYYHNDFGKRNYPEAIIDPKIIDRLLRGELYTLGRHYLGAGIQVELHPLLNLHLTLIENLQDGSGLLLPKLGWDVLQNFQVLFSGQLHFGESETEFGGFSIPGSAGRTYSAADTFSILATWYF